MTSQSDADQLIKEIRALVAADRLERAIEEMQRTLQGRAPELESELVQHQASLTRSRIDGRRGLLPWTEEERVRTRIRFAILELLNQFLSDLSAVDDTHTQRQKAVSAQQNSTEQIPSIFISYSHSDRSLADELSTALQNQGIRVQIDNKSLGVGENIEMFIYRSVRDTDATILVVSRKSLLSPWVGLETVNRFEQEKWAESKILIACYLDDGFWAAGFRLEATKEIDGRIKEIDELIPQYIEQKLDTDDLNREKSRLYALRNNLGRILDRLKNSLCLDVRGIQLDESVRRIAATLKT